MPTIAANGIEINYCDEGARRPSCSLTAWPTTFQT